MAQFTFYTRPQVISQPVDCPFGLYVQSRVIDGYSHLGPPLWQGCEWGSSQSLSLLRLASKIHLATGCKEATEREICGNYQAWKTQIS